jgi:hypothetical protein
MPKLRVAVHVVAPFLRFSMALQTVPHAAQQLADLRMTDRMVRSASAPARACSCRSNAAAIGDRARVVCYHGFQRAHQRRIGDGDPLAPAAGRRMRPAGRARPSVSSSIPRRTTRRDKPHARLTALMSPEPTPSPRWHAVIRRVRSSNTGHTLRSRTLRAARSSIPPQHRTH